MRGSLDALAALSPRLMTESEPDFGHRRITDWRFRVCGFHQRAAHPQDWCSDHPFTRSLEELAAHFEGLKTMEDEQQSLSLLDAMFRISQWSESSGGLPARSDEWRHRQTAARFVIVLTDTHCDKDFAADGAQVSACDVVNAFMNKRILVHGFSPRSDIAYELASMDGSVWELLTANLDGDATRE